MSDPQTVNLGLYQPTRGSDPGTWDQPVNANTGATDSLFSNIATISLSNSNVTLTTPPNSGAAWSGPYQSQSGLLNLTGTITANIQITIPRLGFFIVWNQCTVASGIGAGAQPSTFYVQLITGNGGNAIGLPYGKKCHVFSDGTNMDFVDLQEPGAFHDIGGLTAMPTWMTACTVLPYLLRDGTIYNNTQYPGLYSAIGNAFGGTPGLSFAVPDSLSRIDVAYDTVGTGRLTTAVSGVNGQTMGSAGGNQSMQQHTHTASTSPNPHQHSDPGAGVFVTALGSDSALDWYATDNPNFGGGWQVLRQASTTQFTSLTVTNANAGTGTSQNVQPTIVSKLPLIKT